MSKYCSLKLFMLLAVFGFASLCSSAATYYNQIDSIRITTFLNKQSSVAGVTNGQQINTYYDANVPTTWLGVHWKGVAEDTNIVLYADTIMWNSMKLADTLDLSQCVELSKLGFYDNQIRGIKLSGCSKIWWVDARNNKLENVDLPYSGNLGFLNLDNNNIQYLNLAGCNNLQAISAANNRLVFLPTTVLPNTSITSCYLGQQQNRIPLNVHQMLDNSYQTYDLNVDLSKIGGQDFVWKDMNNQTIPTSKYTQDGFKFKFKQMLEGTIYCHITSPVNFPNMIVETERFSLNVRYNPVDSAKIRAFLDIVDVNGISNGKKVNSEYNPEFPITYGVTWVTDTAKIGNTTESVWKTKIIDWKEKDLAGYLNLDALNALTYLDVHNNKINILNVATCKKLTYLDASDNLINEINVGQCFALGNLFLANNKLNKLDIYQLSSIVNLDAQNNELDSLRLQNNSSLIYLNLDNNNVYGINESSLPNLEDLRIVNNNFTSLDVTLLARLHKLIADNNNIPVLNFSGNKNLKIVSVRNNGLHLLNLTDANNLEELYAENNNLDYNKLVLPSENGLPALHSLYPQVVITENILSQRAPTINISEHGYKVSEDATIFTMFDLDNNELAVNRTGVFAIPEDMDATNVYFRLECPDYYDDMVLYTIHLHIDFKYQASEVAALIKFLNYPSKFGDSTNGRTNGKDMNPDYDSLNPATYPGVTWKIMDGIKRAFAIDWSNQRTLNGNEYACDLSGFNKLVSFNIKCEDNIERNNITGVNLSNCIKLKSISAEFCSLNTLLFEGCNELEYIDCSDNFISSDFNVSMKKILYIDMTNNRLNAVSISDNTALRELYLSNNLLFTLDIEENSNLTILLVDNNNLSELLLGGIKNLLHLDISHNNLSAIDLAEVTKLQKLYCGFNKLSDLNVLGCIELSALGCENNKLTSLDLMGVHYINYLRADNNALVFSTLCYRDIPNATILHPQSMLKLTGQIDSRSILLKDTLDLRAYGKFDSTNVTNYIPTHYSLRYEVDSSIVPSSAYSLRDGVFTFTSALADKSLFVIMTNEHFPGLALYTEHFNTTPPPTYNANDSMRIRAFLDIVNTSNICNGDILDANYEANKPATYPFVTWTAYGNEYRATKINWQNSSNLLGDLNLTGCTYLDTLIVTGDVRNISSGVTGIVISNCTRLRYVDAANNLLTKFAVSNSNINYLDVSNNALVTLDASVLTLNYLDVSNNKLIFTTTKLTNKPSTFIWEPQAPVVPSDLTLSSKDGYKLVGQSIMNLREYEASQFVWYADSLLAQIQGAQGIFYFFPYFNLKTLYCEMFGKGVFEGKKIRTVPFLLDLNSGISEVTTDQITTYPNPATNFVNIKLENISAKTINVNVYDLAGNLVLSMNNMEYNNEIMINVSSLVVGSYFIEIITDTTQLGRKINIVR